MAQVTRAASKLKFETGDVPTQADFSDLHDSVTWYDEGAGVSDGDKGDLVVSGSGTVWTANGELLYTKVNELILMRALGSTILTNTTDITRINTNFSLINGTIYLRAVYQPSAQTFTGVKWLNQQGSYTASNYNGFGLYSYSGGVLTLVASTTNDGNTWQTSGNGMKSKAFSSTYSAAKGVYFIALLYCSSAQVSAPQVSVGVQTTFTAVTADLTNGAMLSGTLTSQTALLSTITFGAGPSSSNTVPWVALY